MTTLFDSNPVAPRGSTHSRYNTPYRSSWRRMAVSSVFWLGLTALSVLLLAALGMMTTVVG